MGNTIIKTQVWQDTTKYSSTRMSLQWLKYLCVHLPNIPWSLWIQFFLSLNFQCLYRAFPFQPNFWIKSVLTIWLGFLSTAGLSGMKLLSSFYILNRNTESWFTEYDIIQPSILNTLGAKYNRLNWVMEDKWNNNFIWKADKLLHSSFTSWNFPCGRLFRWFKFA